MRRGCPRAPVVLHMVTGVVVVLVAMGGHTVASLGFILELFERRVYGLQLGMPE